MKTKPGFAIATAVLIGGWGASPSIAPAAPVRAMTVQRDACALLTEAEVSTALGVKVAAGRLLMTSSPNICGWIEPGKPPLSARKVLLTLMTAIQFERGETPIEGTTKTSMTGIGDDAYYITVEAFGTSLNVKQGNLFVQVKVGGAGYTRETVKPIEKTVALQVLTRA